jgi:hypothetical protein
MMRVRSLGIIEVARSLDDQPRKMSLPTRAADVHAVPAQWLERGFRLLILRELRADKKPPAFAWIRQHLLRTPQRLSRHDLYFASAFKPEVMTWLIDNLSRPSIRDGAGQPRRNPLWPELGWHGEDRLWSDGTRTVEWFVDVIFPDRASWARFSRALARSALEQQH